MNNLKKFFSPRYHFGYLKRDIKFFFVHFTKTFSLNSLSTILKFISTFMWALVDNAKLLGFYSLSAVPVSIMQKGTIASMIARTKIPSTENSEEESSFLKTSIIIDFVLMALVAIGLIFFFTATHAEIINNLGLITLLFVTMIAFSEAFTSAATTSCISRRRYLWNFLVSNLRIIAVIVFLVGIKFIKNINNKWGIIIWVCGLLISLLAAIVYFRKYELNFFNAKFNNSFCRDIKNNILSLGFYKLSVLLYGIIPFLLIAYTKSPLQVGLFAFALTLANFVYVTIMPSLEQIYVPSISEQIDKKKNKSELIAKIYQMVAISLILTGVLSIILFFSSNVILKFIGKEHFKNSILLLPPLLFYQIFMSASGAFTYSIFCFKKYSLLGGVYIIPFIIAVSCFFFVSGNLSKMLWGLALTNVVMFCLAGCGLFFVINRSWAIERANIG